MELMEFSDLQKLAKAASRKTALTFSANGAEQTFSASDVDAALRAQFELLGGDYASFRRNKNTIFELIEETISEVLPKRVMAQYERFADVKSIAQGDQAIFKIRITEAAKQRAKAFVTRVGLAGRYETMILEGTQLHVATSAIGYAIRIGFEEFLDGRYSFADFTDIMIEAMDDFIYAEIAKALAAAVAQLPTANVFSGAGFDEVSMDNLLAISDSYGTGASTIFCTREFAAKMLPQDKYMSENMKDRLWANGMLGDYKGHTVIILEQSMVDARNEEKVIDPSQAYIFANVGEKPVKVVFEGDTKVRTVENNDDWSTDLQTYMKFGVAVFANASICAYKNTDLKTATH
jgi:hypothetical protein